MAYLSDKERRELKALARSQDLKAEAGFLRRRQGQRDLPAGEFLRFVTGWNELAGHPRAGFRKIRGDRFLL